MDFINEEFLCAKVSHTEIDALLENGWRHFGTYFYRYNIGLFEAEFRRVFVLRIRLADFQLSKSQGRILKRNNDLRTVVRPAAVTPEKEGLFQRHKRRFKDNIPNSIFDFLSAQPESLPCKAMEICVYRDEELLAASFFDVGDRTTSSIYGMFAPEESRRGLGIFTLLLEIEWAKENRKDFHYLGYAYQGNSFYDYKKRFNALEKFDWNGNWGKFDKRDQFVL